jgi:hypothetical protein
MAESKRVSIAGFLTLCTLASAVGQTAISATPEQAPQSETQFSLADVTGNNCTVGEPQSSVADTPGCALSPSANTEEQRRIAARFIDEKLAVWQKRLKLEDWHISVVMTRRGDLKPRTLGGIRWDKGKRSAVMAVQDASDYRLPLKEMLADMEFTVVHELVHLELASLPRSEASRSSEEHAVNQIAEALLRLDSQR